MLFLYVLLSVGLLTWILLPVLHKQQTSGGDPLLQERIQAVEASLKQLHAEGQQKISTEDFTNIERRLLVTLAKLFKRAGISPDQIQSNQMHREAPSDTPETPQPQASEPNACPACGSSVTPDYSFCASCGAALKAVS